MLAMTQVTQGVHNSPAFRPSVQLAEAVTGHAYTSLKIMLAMTQLFNLMRIRIQFFSLMRIRIQLFTLMQIRIQLFT